MTSMIDRYSFTGSSGRQLSASAFVIRVTELDLTAMFLMLVPLEHFYGFR